jgi:hypothetical protein
MPRPSSLTLAKSEIFAHFTKVGPKIYAKAELNQLLINRASEWRLAKTTNLSDFIAFLQKSGGIKTYEFRAEAYDRTIVRYAWGTVSSVAIALTLNPRGYLSHGSAVHLHNLTKWKPKTVYLNVEQSPKPVPRGGLTQSALDKAFAREQRQSNYTFRRDSDLITIIAGKNTGRLGVETLQTANGENLDVTNLERTLIDITVRPAYAGGVGQVIKAYRSARARVSIDRLMSILEDLSYVYPYDQAVGFLMQAAGYEVSDKLMTRPREFDFYLAHGMIAPNYSKTWRLFYPADLQIPGMGTSQER